MIPGSGNLCLLLITKNPLFELTKLEGEGISFSRNALLFRNIELLWKRLDDKLK